MIQEQTILLVADNSGAKKVMCIKVLGGSKKKYAYVGDIIKISVKEVISNSKLKKGDVLKAVIVRTVKHILRKDQSYIRFDNNACVLLNNTTEQLIATRIFGPVTKELKNNNKFSKIISLSSEVI